jgi:hypothetical protein
MKTHPQLFFGLTVLLLCLAAGACGAEPAKSSNPCGLSPGDWCSAAPDDVCGKNKNLDACKRDARCQGIPYKGESVVACIDSPTGFSSNCPSVGCMSKCEGLDEPHCRAYSGTPWYACAWTDGHCWRASDPRALPKKNP